MKKTTQTKKTQMRTVSFQISDGDFRELQAIADRFYQGCFRGNRPMDISDLARFAILDKKKEMAWVLEPKNVISGPWEPRAVKSTTSRKASR